MNFLLDSLLGCQWVFIKFPFDLAGYSKKQSTSKSGKSLCLTASAMSNKQTGLDLLEKFKGSFCIIFFLLFT